MHRISLFSLSFLALLVSACHQQAVIPSVTIPDVVVEEVQIRDVQPYITAPGHAEAFQFVQIPARVSGFLREIRFRPGDIVPAGAPLFLIQPDQYQAEVKAAEAELASSHANLKLAQANLARTKSLIEQGAKTEQDLDTDSATCDEAAANVLRAEANLATAQLNLSYTDVRSPVTGKVDRNFVDIGNMVGPAAIATASSGQSADHSVLTTVAGMDPIYIYFDISDYEFNRMREFAAKNDNPVVKKLIENLKKLKATHETAAAEFQTKQGEFLESLGKAPMTPPGDAPNTETRKEANKTDSLQQLAVAFEVGLIKGATPENGEYPFQGVIDMASNTIDQSTGTITIRGEIPNSDYKIFPGQICRVRIPIWKMPEAVLVKLEAIGNDLNQNYVFTVDEKNVARRQMVTLGDLQSDGTRIVLSGLKKGDRVIVRGIQKARDGKEVKIVEDPKIPEAAQTVAAPEKTDEKADEKKAEPTADKK